MYKIVDRTSPLSNSQEYTLVFENNSPNNWTFVCFQDQPKGLPEHYFSLAWFAMPVAQGGKVVFRWQIEYSFVWSQTGELSDAVIFDASQVKPTNGLTGNNDITFTREPNGAFNFIEQKTGGQGVLTIHQNDKIPYDTTSVGIGMSGTGTFAVQAQPNIAATFTPTPHYYITFGESIQEGKVLNITEMANVHEIVFPHAQYKVIATLDKNNNWSTSNESTLEQNLTTLSSALSSLHL